MATKPSAVPLLNLLSWAVVFVIVCVGDAGLLTRLLALLPIAFGVACGFLLMERR